MPIFICKFYFLDLKHMKKIFSHYNQNSSCILTFPKFKYQYFKEYDIGFKMT